MAAKPDTSTGRTKRDPNAFGDNGAESEPMDPNKKLHRVVCKDGSVVPVLCYRMFTTYDANMGIVTRALRQDEADGDVGTFYNIQGWVLVNPDQLT